jgi:uncharacterized protein (DUF362 family)
MISIIHDPSLEYPDSADHFSPDERYPEYQHEHISPHKNMIYKAVRDCLAQAGLDDGNYGTPSWNPLGKFIRPGDRVFLLCNFANERRPDELMENFRSRCSHGSVIRAMADYILIAAGKDGSVKIGNSPTQVGHWDAVLRDTEADKVLEFYHSVHAPVEAKDLRLYVTDATRLGAIKGVERRNEADGVHVALNEDSLFYELDRKQANRYRVMNYNPNRTKSFHSHGYHEYVINRTILESDVIVGLPKLKTHEKTGITCALKGMVGTVGHKDSLPHHRYGSPEVGGDEYPSDKTGLMRLTSAFHEAIQQTKPDTFWGSFLRVIYKVFCRTIKKWSPVVHGAWWGNDTCWRMVLDLVRIATYANAKGEMQNSPCRRHLVLTDGIVGGEGDGPAFSTEIRSGLLSFSDDLAAADYVNALLMGFDPEKIPLIRESLGLKKYPLLKSDLKNEPLIFNGRSLPASELAGQGLLRFEPQDGWKEVL